MGKPAERQGRKATGLKSIDHGRRVAFLKIKHLLSDSAMWVFFDYEWTAGINPLYR